MGEHWWTPQLSCTLIVLVTLGLLSVLLGWWDVALICGCLAVGIVLEVYRQFRWPS